MTLPKIKASPLPPERKPGDSLISSTEKPKEETPATGIPRLVGSSVQDLKDEHAGAVADRVKRKYKKRGSSSDSGAVVDTEKRDKFIEGLSLFSNMSLDIICSRLPNPKPATDIEKRMWNNGLTQVAEKYFPSFANWDAELALTLAVVVIFTPRLKGDDATPSSDDSGENRNGKDNVRKIAN